MNFASKYFRTIVAILFLGAALFIQACSGHAEEEKQDEPRQVRTAPVENGAVAFAIKTSGMVASKSEVRLSFKIGGIMSRIYADEGAFVKKGQLLASLDLAEINARVQQARSASEKADRDLLRIKRLHEDKVVTLENLQDASTAADVAKANLDIALFNKKHSKIYAPSNGRILKRFGEKGELVGPGTPVFMFGSSSQDWIIRVGLTDRDIVRLKIGDKARVEFDAYPGEQFPAEVAEIAEARDPRSGTFEVELRILSPARKLLSGFVANAELFPTTNETLSLVPVEALVEGDGKNGVVYTVNRETARARKLTVEIDRVFGRSIAIADGLDGVEEVITDGAAYLVDGEVVRIVK